MEEAIKSPETQVPINTYLKRLRKAGVTPTEAESKEVADTETEEVVDPQTDYAFEEMVSKASAET